MQCIQIKRKMVAGKCSCMTSFFFISPPYWRCFSSVGNRHMGKQRLSIGTNCDRIATIEHEFLHALGFWHEQSRSDRDDYVKIMWDRISEGKEPKGQSLDPQSLALNQHPPLPPRTFVTRCPLRGFYILYYYIIIYKKSFHGACNTGVVGLLTRRRRRLSLKCMCLNIVTVIRKFCDKQRHAKTCVSAILISVGKLKK